jgi:hypothetical protein
MGIGKYGIAEMIKKQLLLEKASRTSGIENPDQSTFYF